MMINAQQIRLVLRDELSFGDVEHIQPVEQGSFTWVYKVSLPDRDVSVRVSNDPDAFPIELAAYRRCAATGIPVPEVVGFLPKSRLIGFPTLVLARLQISRHIDLKNVEQSERSSPWAAPLAFSSSHFGDYDV